MLPILRSIVRKACIGQGRRCLSLGCSDLATIGRRSGRLGLFQTGGTLIPPRPFAYVPSLWFNPQISGMKIGDSRASFNVINGSEEKKIQSEGITKSSKTIADSWVNFQRDLHFVIRLKLIIIISDDVVASIMAFIYTVSEVLVNLVLFLMLLFATTLYGSVDIEETENETLEDEEESKEKIVEDEEESEEKIVEDGAESNEKIVEDGAESKDKIVEDGAESKDQIVEDGEESKDKIVEDGEESKDQIVEDGAESKDKIVEDGAESQE